MIISKMDMHLGNAVVSASVLVLLVFLAVSYVFAYLGESFNSDRSTYEALFNAILLLPRQGEVILPFALFIGTLVGLGNLANAQELTVFRAAGVSVVRLYFSLVCWVVLVFLLCSLITESVQANIHDEDPGINGEAISNLWLQDEDTFTFVGQASGHELSNMTEITLDPMRDSVHILHAGKASYDERLDSWRLHEPKNVMLEGNNVQKDLLQKETWDTNKTPEQFLGQLSIDAKELPLLNLIRSAEPAASIRCLFR